MRGILAGLTSMVLLAAVAGAFGQDAAAFDAKHNAVLSKLQSMGHGYYSEKEWAEIDQAVQELVSDAAARNDGDAIVKAAVIRAMVLSDMRRRHGEALEALAAAALYGFDDVHAAPSLICRRRASPASPS